MASDENPVSAEMNFHGATPILSVRELETSIDYYVRRLGFRLNWVEETSGFASVSRGQCHIFLCQGDQGCSGTWLWVGVGDAKALCEEFRASGATIRHPPTNYAWAYEMQVEDPDGHVLRFGSEQKSDEPVGEWLDARGRRWRKLPEGTWTQADGD